MNTLISADNTWVLMSIMVLVVAFSIWMEQTYAWASKISGAIIALICALLLTNLKISRRARRSSMMWSGASRCRWRFRCCSCR